MAASGRYARGSVLTALNLINLSSHTVATAHGTDFITRESNRRDRKTRTNRAIFAHRGFEEGMKEKLTRGKCKNPR